MTYAASLEEAKPRVKHGATVFWVSGIESLMLRLFVRKLIGNRHDRSGGSKIVLDILYYLCSYKLTVTIRRKPSQER